MKRVKINAGAGAPYHSVVDAIIDMHTRGFSADFNLLGDQLFCTQTKRFLSTDQFDVLEMHSFESGTIFAGETVIYGIECWTMNMKGILFQSISRASRGDKNILLQKVSKFWQ